MPASPEELVEPFHKHGTSLLGRAELNARLGQKAGVLVLFRLLLAVVLLLIVCTLAVAGLNMHEGHPPCLSAQGSNYQPAASLSRAGAPRVAPSARSPPSAERGWHSSGQRATVTSRREEGTPAAGIRAHT